MKYIYTTDGQTVIVDDDKYDLLKDRKWHTHMGYASHTVKVDGKFKKIRMQREILGIDDPTKFVDHIDKNRLNNTLANLRVLTLKENNLNRGVYKNNKTGFPGVRKRNDNATNPYQAYIRVNGKLKTIGSFKEPHQAYQAYTLAKCKYHKLEDGSPADPICTTYAA